MMRDSKAVMYDFMKKLCFGVFVPEREPGFPKGEFVLDDESVAETVKSYGELLERMREAVVGFCK